MLKLGSKGAAVASLQQQLNSRGFKAGAVDGDFGKKTQAAVILFQFANNLVSDGRAGEKTMAALNGHTIDRLLKESDIITAAELLDVDVASIKAVNLVESRGTGFLPSGKPIILFERHKFKQYLAAETTTKNANAVAAARPDLCNSKAGGYKGGAAEHQRLAAAKTYNETAALKSASWGLFQIMGFNHLACGFESVQSFVAAMNESEGEQLMAFCSFVKANKLMHQALQQQRWAAFARLYNGPKYKQNNYDSKLANSYLKFSKLATPKKKAA